MPVNRRELLSKLDKLIAAEQIAQPPIAPTLEGLIEEAEEEIPAPSPSPGPSGTFLTDASISS